MRLPRSTAVLAATLLLGSLAACTQDPPQARGASGDGTSSAEVQEQEVDEELRAQLPADVREAGTLTAANTGSFPPYTIVGSDDQSLQGAAADLGVALGQVLGIEIRHTTVDGLSGLLTGMQAERYQLSLGPVGDFKERQSQATFIDYVQEFVVFAVPSGNPKKIEDLASTCGTRIAVQAGGSAEEVIKAQEQTCASEGEEKLTVLSYKDQPSSILAVQSGRADAFFSSQAPLTYFVEQSKGELELAGVDAGNGFEDLYQGAIVPVDSPLRDPVLGAMEILFENGTYEQVMTKWGIKANMIDAPGVDLARS